ncbi:interferon alpha/beta receptor 1b-like [Cheilinus undulatus]|uniref:interferon alpha/beta receptor 1b-like n=1 Tax=Cheilinus undulatus TaxID=241271 RepID=UPI001BD1D206|nr:interferon alpha/beta receptor 1b-like [Cheilinus undulatus]
MFHLSVSVLILYLQTRTVFSELAPPHNVSMVTMNTNYTLTWDYDWNAVGVTFSTEYIPRFKLGSKRGVKWQPACEESPRRLCDLTPWDLHYLSFYILRVRANANGSQSEWVMREFCPDTEASLGPPSSVDLSPAGSDLDIFISDPLTSRNTSMREHLEELYYYILYWEKPEDAMAVRHHSVSSSVNMVTLPGLKAWTWYCVSIQTRYDFYNKSSSFTAPLCMQTQGTLPWWQIFLFFLASLLFFFVLVLLSLVIFFRCYRTIKNTLYPSITLPSYLKQYLQDSPGSDVPRLLTPDSESEHLCKVSICPEPPVLEIHWPPAEALEEPTPGHEPDIRHIRQDSGGSEDSGVYSSGGSSSLRPHPSLSGEGGGNFCQDTFDPQQVKMRDMTPRVKVQLVTSDSGVMDVRL